MPPLPADSIHARACKLKCEKILTRPELTRNYPIVTIRGKYKGGVKIADGYLLDQKYLNLEQRQLLKRLSKTLSGKDRNIMESILRDFTLKEISEADPGY